MSARETATASIETELERDSDRLFPICRSGAGDHQSLGVLHALTRLENLDFASGTECDNPAVPDGRSNCGAYDETPSGGRLAELRRYDLL